MSGLSMFTDRKASFKTPPDAVTDKLVSQETRRATALEDQKRRRAQKIDSSRQLDLFADLNLGPSDDETEEPVEIQDKLHDIITPKAVAAPFVSFLEVPGPINDLSDSRTPTSFEKPRVENKPPSNDSQKKKSKRRSREKPDSKSNKWADRCMYAELLEMNEDFALSISTQDQSQKDGLPEDLENGWVALAPVPVGKRCLAVTHQSSGWGGVVPNTTLRSRVLGKPFMARFPSPLPPLTILDCILDPDWRTNGILHVLDVIQWKGQDIGDCESPFRFWWRDTRLAEIPRHLPSRSTMSPSQADSGHEPLTLNVYRFPYPTSFLPVPYHTNTTLPALSSHVIPLARTSRSISIEIPATGTEAEMDVDIVQISGTQPTRKTICADIRSDGLLLYVSQASYEPGTSPLSSWIPITVYNESQNEGAQVAVKAQTGPLGLFELLVNRRMTTRTNCGVNLHMDDSY